jgi:hypothetical protein
LMGTGFLWFFQPGRSGGFPSLVGKGPVEDKMVI